MCICLFISLVLFLISFIFIYQNPNFEKSSVYECGFNPFSDSRGKFEIKYYIVAILFMIFDLEIVFLFPWVLVINSVYIFGFFVMLFFLYVLLIGFVYELVLGALDWKI